MGSIHTLQTMDDLSRVRMKKGFPKSPLRAVCGDLKGTLWVLDRRELALHVKLGSSLGNQVFFKTPGRALLGCQANLNIQVS